MCLGEGVDMTDMVICDACGYVAIGFGFVAMVSGIDPGICPHCKERALRPAGLLDKVKFVLRHRMRPGG